MASTIGYRGEIGFLQYLHLPPSRIQPITGMLSYHASGVLHLGQCEGGETSDSFRGNRQTTTLRKLPMQAPKAKAKRMRMRWATLLPSLAGRGWGRVELRLPSLAGRGWGRV